MIGNWLVIKYLIKSRKWRIPRLFWSTNDDLFPPRIMKMRQHVKENQKVTKDEATTSLWHTMKEKSQHLCETLTRKVVASTHSKWSLNESSFRSSFEGKCWAYVPNLPQIGRMNANHLRSNHPRGKISHTTFTWEDRVIPNLQDEHLELWLIKSHHLPPTRRVIYTRPQHG